jgi:flagellar biosynthesis anti-sigma factor FlgM
MSNINNDSLRSPFFPNKTPNKKSGHINNKNINSLERNDSERKNELDNISKKHTKVSIDSKIKDFSRFKKAVDSAEDIDRSDLIASLKNRIKSGQYSVDPEKVAEKMILGEF